MKSIAISKDDFISFTVIGNYLGLSEKELFNKYKCCKINPPEYSRISHEIIPDDILLVDIDYKLDIPGLKVNCCLDNKGCFAVLLFLGSEFNANLCIEYCKNSLLEYSLDTWTVGSVVIKICENKEGYVFMFSLLEYHKDKFCHN